MKLPADIGCTCEICRNFIKAAPNFPSEIFEFMAKLGVDVKKPAEVYECEYKVGKVLYGDWYHIVGNYLSGADVWQPVSKNHAQSDPVKMFCIADDFKIGFTHMAALGNVQK